MGSYADWAQHRIDCGNIDRTVRRVRGSNIILYKACAAGIGCHEIAQICTEERVVPRRDRTKGAPKLQGVAEDDIPNAATWRKYVVGWQGHVSQYSDKVGDAVAELLKCAIVDMTDMHSMLSTLDKEIDTSMGSYLFNSVPESLSKRNYGGKMSLLIMLSTPTKLIDHRSITV